jgi:FkbM family methyltransferase
MKFYSQYGEDKVVSEFLNYRPSGNVLEIGANDGITISNSLHFIQLGWGATLIEASPISFERLENLHKNNEKVQCLNFCLSDIEQKFNFYHNITHLNKGDSDLLSTISEHSYFDSKKSGNQFAQFEVDCYRFQTCEKLLKHNKYDLISIDIEGYDYQVLQQINLNKIGCDILIIEYNNNQQTKNKIIEYSSEFGLKRVLLDNRTNIILTV